MHVRLKYVNLTLFNIYKMLVFHWNLSDFFKMLIHQLKMVNFYLLEQPMEENEIK